MQFDLELAHTIGISDFVVFMLPTSIVGFPKQSRRSFKARKKHSLEK